jgi:hypothetical protein
MNINTFWEILNNTCGNTKFSINTSILLSCKPITKFIIKFPNGTLKTLNAKSVNKKKLSFIVYKKNNYFVQVALMKIIKEKIELAIVKN